ncbi:hypothetical protein QBC45DRAFT_414277 [Copromyces sp. CBS 386.78]|nr:hypothetical protein QBC45DRAFT_414277 [Copromyces sp. CBS 386.78]
MPYAVTRSKKCAARRACTALSSPRITFHPSPCPPQPWADPPPTTALRHGPTQPAHPAWNRAAIRRRRDMRLRPSAKGCLRKASTRLACHIPARGEIDSPRSDLKRERKKKQERHTCTIRQQGNLFYQKLGTGMRLLGFDSA